MVPQCDDTYLEIEIAESSRIRLRDFSSAPCAVDITLHARIFIVRK